MVHFIKHDFSISPSYVDFLKAEMKQFDWYSEFVELSDDGTITLFDISDGNTLDAIEQVVSLLNEEAKKTVKLDIIVTDNNEILKYEFDTDTNTIISKYAVDFIWNQ